MILFVFLTLFSCSFSLAAELKPFEAKYSISRNDKKTGEQITRLTQLDDNLWKIEDQIIGTNGLASVIGFNRTETTEFTEIDGQYHAIRHNMKQKAAFSKKQYKFTWNESTQNFDIIHKGTQVTYSPQNAHLISAQMMPIALSKAACRQQQNLNLSVLKHKKPKTYRFSIQQQTQKITAHRLYDAGVKKTTETWFDETKNCLPSKQIHKDHDEPVIKTQLIEFTWL